MAKVHLDDNLNIILEDEYINIPSQVISFEDEVQSFTITSNSKYGFIKILDKKSLKTLMIDM